MFTFSLQTDDSHVFVHGRRGRQPVPSVHASRHGASMPAMIMSLCQHLLLQLQGWTVLLLQGIEIQYLASIKAPMDSMLPCSLLLDVGSTIYGRMNMNS
jgi:hypothetical protein